MVAHPVAVAADVDDVAVVEQAVDQRPGHEIVAEDLAPFVEGLVRGQDGRCGLVAAGHQLEEEHGAVTGDGQVADLVDDEQRRVREGLEPVAEAAGGLRFLERGDQIGKRTVVDAAAVLGRGDREAQRQVRLPDAWRPHSTGRPAPRELRPGRRRPQPGGPTHSGLVGADGRVVSPARRVSLRASYSGRWPSRMRCASAALSRGRPHAR